MLPDAKGMVSMQRHLIGDTDAAVASIALMEPSLGPKAAGSVPRVARVQPFRAVRYEPASLGYRSRLAGVRRRAEHRRGDLAEAAADHILVGTVLDDRAGDHIAGADQAIPVELGKIAPLSVAFAEVVRQGRVDLLRGRPGEKKERIRVDVGKILREPDENPDVSLKPDDIIYVPQRLF